jgi:hypothetical protein
MEGYIGKPNSDPTIVLVSTPKAPGDLMQQIDLEEDSLYHKLRFDYHYGLEGPYPIYSEEQIRQANYLLNGLENMSYSLPELLVMSSLYHLSRTVKR